MKLEIEIDNDVFRKLQMFSELSKESIESIMSQQARNYIEHRLEEMRAINLI